MSIEAGMMIAFLIVTGLSVWKFYMFMPTKPLPDDDTNEESLDELTELMVECITCHHTPQTPLDAPKLLEHMTNHERFDHEHYWRFNQNKLNQLLQRYYIKNPGTGSIPDIYRHHTGKPKKDENGKEESV